MQTMVGSQAVTFLDMFCDTIRAHGLEWAESYYTGKKNKNAMTETEFLLWLRAARAAIARGEK